MSLRIYLVEDSPIVLDRLQQSMQECGMTVVGHAGDAESAIAEIADLLPDVVVVDIALREGTGFHVLKDIDGLPLTKRPIRVVLTNFTGDWYRAAAMRLGAEYFFDKGRQTAEMLDTLQKIPSTGGDPAGGQDVRADAESYDGKISRQGDSAVTADRPEHVVRGSQGGSHPSRRLVAARTAR